MIRLDNDFERKWYTFTFWGEKGVLQGDLKIKQSQ